MIAALSSSWPPGECLVLLLALFGGLVVLVGLWMEFTSEDEKRYEKIGIDGFRKLKARGRCGEIVVMAGILLEIGIGAGLAVKTDIDINKAKTAWRDQRIYAFSAYAKLIVRPLQPINDFETLPKNPWAINWSFKQPYSSNLNQTVMYLGESKKMAKGDIGWTQIGSDNVSESAAIGYGTNCLRFDIHFGADQDDFSNDSLTPNEFDAINLLVPIHCEILAGEVEMSIDNGLMKRTFQIPQQITVGQAATSVATNVTFIPIKFDPEILPK